MELICGVRQGGSMRYSKLNQRLIIVQNKRNIWVINLERKQAEIRVGGAGMSAEIQDFKIFGEKENRVISVAQNGDVLLTSFGYLRRKIYFFGHSCLKFIDNRRETALAMEVCDKNQYAVVGINSGGFSSSRVLVMKIRSNSLVITAILDYYHRGIRSQICLSCCRYFGNHILWVGLPWGADSSAQIYHYDVEKMDFRLLDKISVGIGEVDPCQIHRIGDQLFYTGSEGKVMRLIIGFE